jgi:hypothetical protein
MSDPAKLTRKQEAAIGFLLTERTQEKAAEKTGVSTATLRRWLSLPVFVGAYRQARRTVVEAAVGRLQRATTKAVAALTRNLRCGNPSVEIRSAATILEQAAKGIELLDLTERVAEMERRQAEAETGRK